MIIIRQELQAQISVVAELHDEDLAAGYGGVFLEDYVFTYPRSSPAAGRA